MQGDPSRVVIEHVSPEIDAGRFPAKRVASDIVAVEADIYADGHDLLSARLRYRPVGTELWQEVPMEPLVNDRWRGSFLVPTVGRYEYTLIAWIDEFATWQHDLRRKHEAGQGTEVDLLIGADHLQRAVQRAAEADKIAISNALATLTGDGAHDTKIAVALSETVAQLAAQYADRSRATEYRRALELVVDRPLARFSSWYELFPRSCSPEPKRHGTFKDAEGWLPHIASLGFDVVYLPPIHPIGQAFRKGPNNSTTAAADDPGSPWAIGGPEGGHKAVHPDLGTLEDFCQFVAKARELDISVALDIAFQCSPDHPYVKEHPQWFKWRPDNTAQYAENPPKKYEDIYPFDFESNDWEALWEELTDVVRFWHRQGVRVFRVDNPHTKPFRFWESLINDIRTTDPYVIFLSEAFTRPRMMYQLAKLGFTQSYNYFPWRNTKAELLQYFEELLKTDVREYFRSSLWPNTPDILTEYLQYGGRPAFMARLVLAATLGANYGIYGPPFELCESQAREPGSEEYLDSEKYQIRHWDLKKPHALSAYITRVNTIRRQNKALQQDWNLEFCSVDNDQIIAYRKYSDDGENHVLTVVNLDPHHTQSGWMMLPLDELGLKPDQSYVLHDALGDGRYLWSGSRVFVELNPSQSPAQIFVLRRRVRHESDFEYFL